MSKNVYRGEVLGIDVGSVSISLVCLDAGGSLIGYDYALHHGDTRGILASMLRGYDPELIMGIAVPSGKTKFKKQIRVFDTQVSLMKAVSQLGLDARSILHVGAERFFLIGLDERGNYLQTSHSSSCAAGTGSFLDQQAIRLQLNDTAHLSDMAMQNNAPIPDIAARCSVFAKTDLIHAQQKGYSPQEVLKGLCEAVSRNFKGSIVKGKKIRKLEIIDIAGRTIRTIEGLNDEQTRVSRGNLPKGLYFLRVNSNVVYVAKILVK